MGGGHAHVHVLRSLASQNWPPLQAVLVSPERRPFYSAMVPGYLHDRYAAEELSIDLPGLCRAAAAEFVEATAEKVDSVGQIVHTSAGPLPFDLASLDVGSVPAGLDLPGVREHAYLLRPMRAVTTLRARLDALANATGPQRRPVRIGVVGAGAAGIEIALAARRRVVDRGGDASILLVERGNVILPDSPAAARRTARRLLTKAAATIVTGQEVVAVEPEGVRLGSGERFDVDLVVWASGAAPPPLLARSSLPLSDAGFFSVDATLRSIDGAPVWGAGDCVDIRGKELPKAGVYAVKEGPVLASNLRAAVAGEPARSYRPQSAYLSLLDTADGRALLQWRSFALHSRLAARLKAVIDQRFVARYRSGPEG